MDIRKFDDANLVIHYTHLVNEMGSNFIEFSGKLQCTERGSQKRNLIYFLILGWTKKKTVHIKRYEMYGDVRSKILIVALVLYMSLNSDIIRFRPFLLCQT